MSTETTLAGSPTTLTVAAWLPHPFLHYGPDNVYHPLTDSTLSAGEPGYAELRRVCAGADPLALEAAQREALVAGRWLMREGEDVSHEYLLKYVSLEAHTVCNQACYFCPVSVEPRADYFMPTAQYETIVEQLADYRDTLEAVFMISYNEPTVDKRFVDQVRTIRAAGLPPATLTNGTGLTRDRVDALVELGGLRFLSINLSTVDRRRYHADRGGDHLELVLRNLDYARNKPVAEQMDIVVLGVGDEQHDADYRAIAARFAGSRFTVKHFVVNDRAAYLTIGSRVGDRSRKLRGCEYLGSRPLQHLHITPRGKCILCCQDYSEQVVVGDLNVERVADVLRGPALAQMRRWAYGLETAPADFICRGCTMAITCGG